MRWSYYVKTRKLSHYEVKKEYTLPFILIHESGWTKVFYDITECGIFCKNYYIKGYHRYFCDDYWYNDETKNYYKYFYSEWILRDDKGRVFTNDDFDPIYIYDSPKFMDKNHYEKLGLTIPNTGKRGNYGYRRNLRFKKIHKQREEFNDWKKDYKIKGRNSKENLPPTSWDDVGKSNWRDKNWKNYRKTQYK